MILEGPLSGPSAIAIVQHLFLHARSRLGPEGMHGRCTGVSVSSVRTTSGWGGPAAAGFLGSGHAEGIEPNEAIMMAIGQGPISWTPLHAADAYAALARRGLRIEPSLVRDRKRPDYSNLGWNAAAVDAALEGLRQGVAEEYGTANHISYDTAREPLFNAQGVSVMAKTGTGQATSTRGEDPDGDGPSQRDSCNGRSRVGRCARWARTGALGVCDLGRRRARRQRRARGGADRQSGGACAAGGGVSSGRRIR